MSHEPESAPQLRERESERSRQPAAEPFQMTEPLYAEFLLFACGVASDVGRKEFSLSPLLYRFVEEAVKRGHLECVGDDFKMTDLGWKTSQVEEIDYTPPPRPHAKHDVKEVAPKPEEDSQTDEWTSE